MSDPIVDILKDSDLDVNYSFTSDELNYVAKQIRQQIEGEVKQRCIDAVLHAVYKMSDKNQRHRSIIDPILEAIQATDE